MVERFAATLTSAPEAGHGEGPVWMPATEELWYVDMFAGDIVKFDPRTGRSSRHHVGTMVAAFRPRVAGGIVLALERGFALMDAAGRTVVLEEVWGDGAVRMNDGSCDAQGRFYCGSMAYDASAGRGALFRLNRDMTTTRVLSSLTVSNGLAFTADGLYAFHVDSPTREIRRFAITDDDWTRYRTFVAIEPGAGVPDGICMDAEGGIWVALWGGAQVRRYDKSGRLTTVVDLPVPRVTACALGGPDLRDLYITTSSFGETENTHPLAGRVFGARVQVQGVPPLPCEY